MKHKHLNQETSKYQSDSRTVTSEPLHASSSKLNNPTLENSHISCLDLDLDLDFTNGRYDYDVNLSISPIIILNVSYAYRITALPITSTATMRQGVYESDLSLHGSTQTPRQHTNSGDWSKIMAMKIHQNLALVKYDR